MPFSWLQRFRENELGFNPFRISISILMHLHFHNIFSKFSNECKINVLLVGPLKCPRLANWIWHDGFSCMSVFWYLQFSQKLNEKIQLYSYGTPSRIVFVRFLGELKTPKRHFEIKWPLVIKKKFWNSRLKTENFLRLQEEFIQAGKGQNNFSSRMLF